MELHWYIVLALTIFWPSSEAKNEDVVQISNRGTVLHMQAYIGEKNIWKKTYQDDCYNWFITVKKELISLKENEYDSCNKIYGTTLEPWQEYPFTSKPPKFPDRPSPNRPDIPGSGRPDIPGYGRPDIPGSGRPERPGSSRPETPGSDLSEPSERIPTVIINVYEDPRITTFVTFGSQNYRVNLHLRLMAKDERCIEDMNYRENPVSQYLLKKGTFLRTVRDKLGLCWKVAAKIDLYTKGSPPFKSKFDPSVDLIFLFEVPEQHKHIEGDWIITVSNPEAVVTETLHVRNRYGTSVLIIANVGADLMPTSKTRFIDYIYETTIKVGKMDSLEVHIQDKNNFKWKIVMREVNITVDDRVSVRDTIRVVFDFRHVKKINSPVSTPSQFNSGDVIFIPNPMLKPFLPNDIKHFQKIGIFEDPDGQLNIGIITIIEGDEDEEPDFLIPNSTFTISIDTFKDGCMERTLIDGEHHTYILYMCLTNCGRNCITYGSTPEKGNEIQIDINEVRNMMIGPNFGSSIQVVPDNVTATPLMEKIKIYVLPDNLFPSDFHDGLVWHIDTANPRKFRKTVQLIQQDELWTVEIELTAVSDKLFLPELNIVNTIITLLVIPNAPHAKSSKTLVDRSGGLWIVQVELNKVRKYEFPDLRITSKYITIELDLSQLQQKRPYLDFEYRLVPQIGDENAEKLLVTEKPNKPPSAETQLWVKKDDQYWKVTVEVTGNARPLPPYINVANEILKLIIDLERSFTTQVTLIDSNLQLYNMFLEVKRVRYSQNADVQLGHNDFLYIYADLKPLQERFTQSPIHDGIAEWTAKYVEPEPSKSNSDDKPVKQISLFEDKEGVVWEVDITLQKLAHYRTPDAHFGQTLILRVTLDKETQQEVTLGAPDGSCWSAVIEIRRTNRRSGPKILRIKSNVVEISFKMSGFLKFNGIPWDEIH